MSFNIEKAGKTRQDSFSTASYADRFRWTWWPCPYHQKPGYVRRQKQFFGAVARNRLIRIRPSSGRLGVEGVGRAEPAVAADRGPPPWLPGMESS